jgi:hypothetical protein
LPVQADHLSRGFLAASARYDLVGLRRHGPPAEARAALAAMGFVEERDFVCAA